MSGLLRAAGWWLKNRCLRPVWRSLAAFGSMHFGPGTSQSRGRSARRRPAAPPRGLTRRPWRRLLVLPPGVGGPPPAHPERLCAEVPLTAQERLLARELWPGYEQHVRGRR
nr:DUF6059 family protein [Streptomyces antibioticus]